MGVSPAQPYGTFQAMLFMAWVLLGWGRRVGSGPLQFLIGHSCPSLNQYFELGTEYNRELV